MQEIKDLRNLLNSEPRQGYESWKGQLLTTAQRISKRLKGKKYIGRPQTKRLRGAQPGAAHPQIAKETWAYLICLSEFHEAFHKNQCLDEYFVDLKRRDKEAIGVAAFRNLESFGGGDYRKYVKWFEALYLDFCQPIGGGAAHRCLSEMDGDECFFEILERLEPGAFSFRETGKGAWGSGEEQSTNWQDRFAVETVRGQLRPGVSFLVVTSVDCGYLGQYWPHIMLTHRSVEAQGGQAWLDVVVSDKEEIEWAKRVLWGLGDLQQTTHGDCSASQLFSVTHVERTVVTKALLASRRFFLAARAAEQIAHPIFCLDAEVLPKNPAKRFLGKAKDSSSVVAGSTRGVKTLMPWRRWLASELVFMRPCKTQDQLKTLCRAIEQGLMCDPNWFVDQNAIYWLLESLEQYGHSVQRAGRVKSKFPWLQESIMKKLTTL